MKDENERLPFWLLLALESAKAMFVRDLAEDGGGRPGQAQEDLGRFLLERKVAATCPQCRRDVLATIQPNAPELRTPVGPYHPLQCPYLRPLVADLLNRLSRDPSLLKTWHDYAVQRYAKRAK
jgi:hypothetical protein